MTDPAPSALPKSRRTTPVPLTVATSTRERSVDEVEADLAATRERLADSLSQLKTQLKPKNVAQRSYAKATRPLRTPDGAIRPELVGAGVGAVVVAVVVWRLVKRRG